MAFTQNFNSDTFGPIQWKLMGPIADRPATAELHTTYLSTDEGDGLLRAYLYTENGWVQMQGIEGFTGGGGALPAVTAADNGKVLGVDDGEWAPVEASGGGGVVVVSGEWDAGETTITLDKTYNELKALLLSGAVVVMQIGDQNGAIAYNLAQCCLYGGTYYALFFSAGFDSGGTPEVFVYPFSTDSADGYPAAED